MHFHLPKPLHGWRQFAGEVGIIVVGVLIALAAEQVVEILHWRRDVKEARQSMNAELAFAEGSGFEIMMAEKCRYKQLDRLDALIEDRTVPAHMRADLFGLRPWATASWEAATASGAVARMNSKERNLYSTLFSLVLALRQLHRDAYETNTDLKSINHHTVLTDVSRDRYAQEISRLRQLNSMMSLGSRQLINAAKPLHIPVPDGFRKSASEFRCLAPDPPAETTG